MELLTPKDMISSLASSRAGISAAFYGITDEQAKWQPAPGKWSMLEVLAHLLDEEREDFRQRIQYLLEKPGEAWPPIDPEGWVVSRGYNDLDVYDTLGAFEAERDASLVWLRGLEDPDWDRSYEHPQVGTIKAGDLLAAWAAHDYMHIRQLSNLCVAYTSEHSTPYSTKYAAP